MKELFLKTFGTDHDGRRKYEWTDHKSSTLYDEVQATIDCDLLNRFSPDRVTPEGERKCLILESFRIVKVGEGQFCIAFESRTETERAALAIRT